MPISTSTSVRTSPTTGNTQSSSIHNDVSVLLKANELLAYESQDEYVNVVIDSSDTHVNVNLKLDRPVYAAKIKESQIPAASPIPLQKRLTLDLQTRTVSLQRELKTKRFKNSIGDKVSIDNWRARYLFSGQSTPAVGQGHKLLLDITEARPPLLRNTETIAQRTQILRQLEKDNPHKARTVFCRTKKDRKEIERQRGLLENAGISVESLIEAVQAIGQTVVETAAGPRTSTDEATGEASKSFVNVLEAFNNEGAVEALQESMHTVPKKPDSNELEISASDISHAKKVGIVAHLALVARAMNHRDSLARIIEAYPRVLDEFIKFTNVENVIDKSLLHGLVMEYAPALDLTKEQDLSLARALSKVNKTFARNALKKIRTEKRSVEAKDVLESSLIFPDSTGNADEDAAGRASAILMNGPLELLRDNTKLIKKLSKAEKITLRMMILAALCAPAAVGTHGAIVPFLSKLTSPLTIVINEFLDKSMKPRDWEKELLKFLAAAHEKCKRGLEGDSKTRMLHFFSSLEQNLRILEK